MIKYVAVILTIILLGNMIQLASADWLDYMSWRLDSNEILGVCLYQPQEHNIQNSQDYILGASLLAIEEWEKRLKEYTGNEEYDIQIHYIPVEAHEGKSPRDFSECNVHITYWEDRVQNENVNETTLGVTWSEGSIMGVDMTIIEIYPKVLREFAVVEKGKDYTPEEIRELTITQESWVPPSGIYSVVLHEFGHAIGLGHQCQEPYGHSFKSVMVPQFDPFKDALEISDYDLAAVYNSYGKDGWEGNDGESVLFKFGSASPFFRGIVRCT